MLPANIDDMKDRLTAAINVLDYNVLRHIWDEFSYQLDVEIKLEGIYSTWVQTRVFYCFLFLIYHMMIDIFLKHPVYSRDI